MIVDCGREIHHKIALIDAKVVWFGSLSPLSHTTRTEETMLRALAPGFASDLARLVQIGGRRRDDEEQNTAIIAENPRCGNCGHRTYYFRSQKGQPLFACESERHWVQHADSIAPSRSQQGPADQLPQAGPPCPNCGKKTRLQQGRYGPFYGCTGSKCHRTMNVRQAMELLSSNGESKSQSPAEPASASSQYR